MALQWEQLSNRQKKEYGSKSAFKAAKKSTRASGGSVSSAKAIKTVYRAPTPSPSPAPTPTPSPAPSRTTPAPSVSNVNDFDRTAGGAGSNRGTDRLSSADLKNLRGQGHSLEDIVSYAEKSYEEGSKGGGANSKAGRLLAQYKSELTSQTAPTPAPPPTQASIQKPAVTISPDQYQSSKKTSVQSSQPSTQTNNVSSGIGGKNSVSINQSNTQDFNTTQDNDIITSVSGDDNVVDNLQDNSLKNNSGNQSNNADVSSRSKAKEKAISYKDKVEIKPVQQPMTDVKQQQPMTDVKQLPQTDVKQQNSQDFNTTQDNDIINTVTGNNNRIENNVDNSIRNYGGNQKNFTYVGGKDPSLDTPVSAATTAGFYHDEDSPSKSSSFIDRYITMNRDNAKRRESVGSSALDFISKAQQLPGFNHRELDKFNRQGPQVARDRAAGMALNLFGDRFKASVESWQSPERQSAIEQPDYDELYDKYTDF